MVFWCRNGVSVPLVSAEDQPESTLVAHMGVGQNSTGSGLQVLVLLSIYQGSILGTYC